MDLKYHDRFMKRAMKLAERGRGFVSPNPVVGAVLVRGGKIIAEDWHRKFGEGHAERNLLEKKEKGKDKRKKEKIGSRDVLYVTLEPCCHTNKKTEPCTDIILKSGVKKVVVGMLDPNPEVSGRGVKLLRKNGVEVVVLEEEVRNSKHEIRNKPQFQNSKATNYQLQTTNLQGLLEELKWQNRFFFTWVRERKPWVALKIAQTLDGRVTRHPGEQLWLTGDESRKHVHEMRAQFDAILVGVKTVIADDPELTVRLAAPVAQIASVPRNDSSPRVVILDAALSIPLESKVVRPGTIIFCGRQFRRRKTRKEQLIDKGCIVLEADTDAQGFLNLREILAELAARGIASLYVEGGPTIWSSFVREGLANELMVYFAPKFLGDGVASLETIHELSVQNSSVRFRQMKVLGGDFSVNYEF